MALQFDFTPGYQAGPNGSGTRAEVIVPSDGDRLPFVANKIWVGTPGSITLLTRDSLAPVTFENVPSGMFKMSARQVFATGTTAAGLIGVV